MAAPPDLSSFQASDFHYTNTIHPPSDTPYMAASNPEIPQNHLVPPFAPTPPPAVIARTHPPSPPPAPAANDPLLLVGENEQGSRNEQSHSRDGSRSRSRSPSSHNSEDDEESDHEEAPDPQQQWRPLIEDTSVPCADEIAVATARGEHRATDDEYWHEQTFLDVEAEGLVPIRRGHIDWTIPHFNGTKDDPNTQTLMQSPVVHIGGYDWRIKFYPKGNSTDFMSAYIECVTMQDPEYAEYEDFKTPPFPFLEGQDTSNIRKRRTFAAQLSLIVYNPAEPRAFKVEVDAHRFSKASADYGWRYFAQLAELQTRSHGQRQAILRNDKLALKAHIRVLKDPSGSMWAHDHTDHYKDCLQTTALRPFAGQAPHLMAMVALLHFRPFRTEVREHTKLTRYMYSLQTILWKMFSRDHSAHYKRRPDPMETIDTVSCIKTIAENVLKECGSDLACPTLGSFDVAETAFSHNRLRTKDFASLQEAINNHPTALATPELLTLELQRQEFDTEKRKWRKLTNKVKIDSSLTVREVKYELYAVITHCGELQSNKHNAYIKPDMDYDVWYAYTDRRVTIQTREQAVDKHEGVPPREKENRRDSPFGDILDPSENSEVIYVALYRKCANYSRIMPVTEKWDVPNEIQKGLDLPQAKEAKLPPQPSEEVSDLSFRAEQLAYEQQQHAAGAATPEWPMTDCDGDVIMSDTEDDMPSPPTELAQSTTLAALPTKPSRSHKYLAVCDSLGREWYSGEMFGDKYQGQGHLVTTSGDQYVGNFYQGKYEGRGRIVYASTGDIYDGEWLGGKHHGQGSLLEVATGNVFEGGWKEGEKHGEFLLRGKVTEEDRGHCTICYERKLTTAFYDCGHVLTCKECAEKLDTCPVCRRKIHARLQIYGVKMSLQ
ncbi:hypothetical protein LTR78_006517 [Recurvomyces mirabilis]|uniref:Uncharacterized protein n=1 Tax=Recurvomyces mirabilis TaxID=574656 RepID=A0AAE1BZZ3_9PEZI|nr:hypothetical protein LTR78_006517 [Recurvomyces mirabilis]